MIEIGSEFWNVPLSSKDNNLFNENTKWYLSGRIALMAIIDHIKRENPITTISLPSWCCESMIIPFLRSNIDVSFYDVYYKNEELVFDYDSIGDVDSILLMDYFGFENGKMEFDFDGIIIKDITHSILCDNYSYADYYFGSLRKIAGFITGGFAWSKNCLIEGEKFNEIPFVNKRREAIESKKLFIESNGSLNSDKKFLSEFNEAERLLYNENNILIADNQDIFYAKYMDTEYIKERRKRNASILVNELKDYSLFKEVKSEDCPVFVPLLINEKNRDKLRNYLIDNKIYCPIHWPLSKYHKINKKSKEIYNQEISLVCDQRYDDNDMDRIVENVKKITRRINLC